MKQGFIIKSGGAEQDEMERINAYTRRKYTADEVYTFSVVLCDNEVDRDFECFSTSALEKLSELFVGKTCIFDHERKSANQTARIYETALVEEGKNTRNGDAYLKLTAKAYLPRTQRSEEVINLIEAGILKEVSISCSVKNSICTICGKEHCNHVKGQLYGEKLCSRILNNPTDAYECSFVAVPAQRAAGVTKSFKTVGEGKIVIEKLKSVGEEGVSLTKEEASDISRQLDSLREKAGWGEMYRDSLTADILKYSAVVQPEMPGGVMKSAVAALSLSELSLMGKTYEKMAEQILPLKPQLVAAKERMPIGNNEFKI